MLLLNFSFLIEGIRFFRYKFCTGDSCSVLFLIHDEYGIGLNVDFPNKCTSLCSKLFICVCRDRCLHSSLGDVSSFAGKNFIICGISTVVFRIINSSDVF